MAESYPNGRSIKVPVVEIPDYFFMPVMRSDEQIIRYALTLAIRTGGLKCNDSERADAILRIMAISSNPKTAYGKADMPE